MAENELNTLEITGEVPPVEEIPTEGADETPPADAEDQSPPVDEPPDPAAMQADIEKLRKAREKAEADARYWRQEKARARADYFKDQRQPAQPPAAKPAETPPEPNQDDYDDYDQYIRAQAAWQADRRVEAKVAQWQQEQQQQAQSQAYQEKMNNLQAKINEGIARFDDFEDVALSETVPITETVMEALAECEDPAGVAYYLGQNRTEAIQVARMSPLQAARKLAQIELELSTKQPNKKTVTSAPPPIKPVGSSGSIEKDPDKMTQKEFEQWRISQGAKPY